MPEDVEIVIRLRFGENQGTPWRLLLLVIALLVALAIIAIKPELFHEVLRLAELFAPVP